MKRFRRWLFNGVAGLSLIIGLLVFLLARPGEEQSDCFFHRTGGGTYYFLEFLPGEVCVERSYHTETVFDPEPLDFHFWENYRYPAYKDPTGAQDKTPRSIWNRLGFWSLWGFDSVLENHEDYQSDRWIMPVWFPAGILAVMPAIAVASMMRRRRRRFGNTCSSCGYDLRATPDRCPECGMIPAKK